MKLETFFEKFDQFADAPDAVAKMRGLILRLAMQGKLSEPHKGDVPVTDLLCDVEKERVALGIKSAREAENGSSETEFFEIPSRWAWVQFGELARHNAGKTLDKGRNRGELRDYITTSNLYWGFFQLDEVRQMPIEDEDLDRCTATKGDLLIVEGGEAGRASVWCHDYDIAFQNHIHRARFFGGINPYFVQRYFETLNATGDIDKFRKGVGISNMSGKALASIPVPIPPLAEQKRIVAKVDELMALCDRLEAQQQERETRHAALARASLARFADAPTSANLAFLFHPSYAIPPADLRKSILTLAVQGKLVPQELNDEPAEELAAELARLKTQLLAGRRIRNQKVLGCPREDDFPFEIPSSWKWVRLGHAVMLLGGYAYESGAYVPTSSNQIIRLGNVKSDALLLDQKPAFIPDALAEQTAEYTILEGDILVTMTGTKAKRDYAFTLAVKRADLGGRRLFLNQRVGAIRPFQRELVPLINVFLKSDQLLDLVFATATGTANQANIGTSSILDLPFPLPPLAEQLRIVAKVEELMALVDALETQLAASRATTANLLSAFVVELTV